MGRGAQEEVLLSKVTKLTGGRELLAEVARVIDREQKLLVLGHISPDADCLGASIALARYLRHLGKDAIAFAAGVEPLPTQLSFLGLEQFGRELPSDLPERTVIVLDCALLANTGIPEHLSEARGVIQIDHHVTDNQRFAYWNVLEDASSASELVAELIKKLGHRENSPLSELIDSETASALYAGIVSDSGRFRHDNTSAGTLRIAAELVDAGANPSKIADALYVETPFRKMKLIGQALSSASLHIDEHVMICRIRQEDFRSLGVHENDGSRMVNQLGGTEGVQVVCLIMERESRKQEGVFRVMLRSQAGIPDVAAIARLFGGGGHPGAASFTLEAPIEEIEARLLAAFDPDTTNS